MKFTFQTEMSSSSIKLRVIQNNFSNKHSFSQSLFVFIVISKNILKGNFYNKKSILYHFYFILMIKLIFLRNKLFNIINNMLLYKP